ncbi:MAG: hypothetical protein J6T20_04870 [Treponema sp.]|nr:hypothetical protein [Treponema sp.]
MTVKILLIATLVLTSCTAIFFFLWRSEKAKLKEKDAELKLAEKELNETIASNIKLESTISILKKNRSESDEKINSLHSGNSTANALSELRMRKG